MTAPHLPSCPYRRGNRGSLICSVAEMDGGTTSNITVADVCMKCDVPQRLVQSNCKHLQTGTRIFRRKIIGGEITQLQATLYDCPIYQFASEEALFAQCLAVCPGRKPIHRDLSQDELLTVPALPERPTDRDLRQGVLLALYEYHARFPDRYLEFDVTPEHLASSLSLKLTDVVRVLGPMDEAGEIRTLQDTRDVLPRYVTITQKGIEAMNDEPLFESKGVRVTDNSIKIEGNNNQVARDHGRNEQVNIQSGSPALQELVQQLTHLRARVEQEPEFIDVQSEALDTIDMVLEETQRPEPRPNRLTSGLKSLHRLMEGNQGTVAAAALVLQLVGMVVGAG